MFAHYSEKARRVIFFARYEASQSHHDRIQTEDLLLGLMRADKHLFDEFDVEQIRKDITARTTKGEGVQSTSVDLPLSTECKAILQSAEKFRKKLDNKIMHTAHLLAGISLRERQEGERDVAVEVLAAHHITAITHTPVLQRMAARSALEKALATEQAQAAHSSGILDVLEEDLTINSKSATAQVLKEAFGVNAVDIFLAAVRRRNTQPDVSTPAGANNG